ncbi:DUF5999 family protein [Streptomyces sp. CA-256286]|uniref:DUF5999 family protein n=1 Tax=Streptomyces sp. CA-256286 TaxID=2801033 RepID=UPI001A981F88|nr:DUF5999 family protein [Streptomyces sp. CA-256286]QTA36722.1 hypothetical protein JHY03_69380 [Streptomyces sp. CA-256286]
MCKHSPTCPNADAADHEAAKAVLRDDVTGFARLCNGVILFNDTGELLPDNTIIAPHRSGDVRQAAAA